MDVAIFRAADHSLIAIPTNRLRVEAILHHLTNSYSLEFDGKDSKNAENAPTIKLAVEVRATSSRINATRSLRTLAHFRGQSSSATRRCPAWRQLIRSDGRTMFDCTDHRCFVHAIGIGHGRKTLLAAHAVDHALLPRIQHSVRKNGKIAKHPQQIDALKE